MLWPINLVENKCVPLVFTVWTWFQWPSLALLGYSLDTANNGKYVLMVISNEMRSGMKSHSKFIGAPAVGTEESKELVNWVSRASVQYRLGYKRGFLWDMRGSFSRELLLGSHSEHWRVVSWEFLELSYWVVWWKGRWGSKGEAGQALG